MTGKLGAASRPKEAQRWEQKCHFRCFRIGAGALGTAAGGQAESLTDTAAPRWARPARQTAPRPSDRSTPAHQVGSGEDQGMRWAGGKLGSEAAGPGLNPTLSPASGWPEASHLARANLVSSFVKKIECTRTSCLGSKVTISVRCVCILSTPGEGSGTADSVLQPLPRT